MAASAGKMVGVCEDSSSSDEEELRRCQEAVWDSRGHLSTGGNSTEKQSKRVVVSAHEHDGNELQVSEGFRTHVAHKLGNLLDSCITETQTEASSCVESEKRDEDEGFRLFSTSVPGRTAGDAAAPARRRPAPSSSDSDSEAETRLREAAVSITDLIPSFTASSTNSHPCSEKQQKKKKKKHAEEEESLGVKKKKKKKRKETTEEEGSPLRAEGNGDLRSSEQEHELLRAKQKKKKKKKQREGNTEEASN